MNSQVDKFYHYLEELHETYSRLVFLLKEKARVVETFDIGRLDEIMKEEQTIVLVTKGFDQNIKRYRDSIGFTGESLIDIVEEMPEERRQDFRVLYANLRAVLEESRVLNEQCQGLIKDRLQMIEKRIQELDRAGTAPYGVNGNKTGAPKPGVFSKTV